MKIEIAFHGMCAFAPDSANGRFDVLMHPEGGAHFPVLTIPIKQIVIGTGNTTWNPDLVGHDEAGNEIGMWDLRGQSLEIGNGAQFSGFTNRNTGFDLKLYHRRATTRPESDWDGILGLNSGAAYRGARVRLLGSGCAFEMGPRPLDLNWQKVNAGTVVENGDGQYAPSVRWFGDVDDGEIAGQVGGSKVKIELRDDGTTDWRLRITSVAQVPYPDGLSHFRMYYDFINLAADDFQLQLTNRTADMDVFDCVPPVIVP